MAVTDDPSGRDALDQIDRAMAARPHRDSVALSAAVASLASFRDVVIAADRRDGVRRYRPTLDRINAVLSVVLAAEFPLAGVPWDEVAKARTWLAGIIGDAAAGGDAPQ